MKARAFLRVMRFTSLVWMVGRIKAVVPTRPRQDHETPGELAGWTPVPPAPRSGRRDTPGERVRTVEAESAFGHDVRMPGDGRDHSLAREFAGVPVACLEHAANNAFLPPHLAFG